MSKTIQPARIGLGLLAVLTVVLLWRILTLGLADLWAPSFPERALFWRPEHPDALRYAAEKQFDSRHYAAAELLARRGIQAYALDGRNYRELGLIADARGQASQAFPLFQVAAARSPRDLLTHQKLAEYALKAGDVEQTLLQLDLFMRLDWTIGSDLLPRMVRLAEYPGTQSAFVRALAQQPPWRTPFLQMFASQARDPAAVDRLYRRLDSVPGQSLSTDETTAWVNRQIRDRYWEQAYATWVSSLPAVQRAALGNVFDGDFVFPPSQGGFGWQMPAVAGAVVRTLASTHADGGKALVIEFDGIQMLFRDVSQLMVLSPGRYVLHGRANARALDTGRGLQWVLTCAEDQQHILASSPLLVGSQPWKDFAVPFEVPASVCGGQWLRLQMGAPDQISGQAAYAALSVERAPTPGPPVGR